MSVGLEETAYTTDLPEGVVSRITIPDSVSKVAIEFEGEETTVLTAPGDYFDYYADGRKMYNGTHVLKRIHR
jgi:hypothetical protein